MHNEQALFDELSAALQFPYYFGENWDALDECLSDLSWLQGRHYVIIVTEAEHVLKHAPDEFKTFARMLSHLGDDWAKAAPQLRPWAPEASLFRVIFNASPNELSSVESRLQDGAVPFARNLIA